MGNSHQPSANSDTNSIAAAIVTSGCLLKGELVLTGPLHVNGTVKGHIQTPHQLLIGSGGRVEGTADADHIVISGHFTGTINARSVEFLSGSFFDGVLRASYCACEIGGRITGDIQTSSHRSS